MNISRLHVCFGLTLGLFGSSAFATSGNIDFEGMITSSTCPIEIVNPGDGTIGNLVNMVDVEASRFTAVNQDRGGKTFSLRLSPDAGCALDPTNPNTATVTFRGLVDLTGDHYAIKDSGDPAKGVVIVIKNKLGEIVKNGVESSPFDLSATSKTDMEFEAFYRSSSLPVSAGTASANIGFVVKIN